MLHEHVLYCRSAQPELHRELKISAILRSDVDLNFNSMVIYKNAVLISPLWQKIWKSVRKGKPPTNSAATQMEKSSDFPKMWE